MRATYWSQGRAEDGSKHSHEVRELKRRTGRTRVRRCTFKGYCDCVRRIAQAECAPIDLTPIGAYGEAIDVCKVAPVNTNTE